MKLIAVDLDGTLLNHSKEVLESSRQAIAAAAAAGVQVVVASGRSFPEAQRFVAGTACSEHVICAGGAAIVNRTSGVSRHTWYLDCQTAARVLRQGAACGMAAFAYTANQIWMEEADYNAIFSNMPGFRAQRVFCTCAMGCRRQLQRMVWTLQRSCAGAWIKIDSGRRGRAFPLYQACLLQARDRITLKCWLRAPAKVWRCGGSPRH